MKHSTLQSAFSSLRRLGIASGVLAAAALAHRSAAATAYGIDGNGNLRVINNLSTMSSSVLGLTPFTYGATNGNVGLAMSPSGQLYAGDQFGNIWALSMTGVATPIGNTGVAAPITGLDWDPINNSLLVFTGSPAYQIFRASPTTGAQISAAISVNLGGGRAESIAWLNPSRALITFKDPGNTISIVQLVGLGSGSGSLVGTPDSISILQEWTGVDVDPSTGTIHMIGWLDDSWQVANATGTLTATHIATGNHLDWTAFTMESIPEPSGVALLACGLAFLTARRRGPEGQRRDETRFPEARLHPPETP